MKTEQRTVKMAMNSQNAIKCHNSRTLALLDALAVSSCGCDSSGVCGDGEGQPGVTSRINDILLGVIIALQAVVWERCISCQTAEVLLSTTERPSCLGEAFVFTRLSLPIFPRTCPRASGINWLVGPP
jgi:hypothetical protein